MKIHQNTVSDLLWEILSKLMRFEELASFRLVGGTSLSLLLGHRKSIDIDLFTDANYGTIDFEVIDKLLINSFPYVQMRFSGNSSVGKTYFIGNTKNDSVKIDMFYTDKFVFPLIDYMGIRLSQLEEIAAMKLEVIGHNGRKKDFWDLHELLNHFTILKMFEFYKKRNPYGYSKNELIEKLVYFDEAENDFDPICLRNKYWEIIKLDFEEIITTNFR